MGKAWVSRSFTLLRGRWTGPLVAAGVAAALFFAPTQKVPGLDGGADAYFQSAITKAGVAYAATRGLNAIVSVVKESELHVQPAGLGISIAAGQILDPLDDMTERASDVLVTAIVSLGIQKVVYEIALAFAPPLAIILLVLWIVLGLLRFPRARVLREGVMGVLVVLLVARFCLPVSAIANGYLHDRYFAPRITSAENGLKLASTSENVSSMELPKSDGLFKGFDFVKERASAVLDAAKELVSRAAKLIDTLLELTFLYVAYFVVQVVLLPVAVFWGMVRLINLMFRTDLATHLSHADLARLVSREPQPR